MIVCDHYYVLGYCTYLWFNLRSPNYCESFYCKNEHGYQKGSPKNKKENIQEHFTYFADLKQYWDVNTRHPSLSPLPLSLSLSLSLSPMHPIYSETQTIKQSQDSPCLHTLHLSWIINNSTNLMFRIVLLTDTTNK